MNEVKFKAWDLSRKCMIEVNSLYFFEEEGIREVVGGIGKGHHADYMILQYTGLKDKNGKDIYEGDVVEVEGYFCSADYHTYTGQYAVGFSDGSFSLKGKGWLISVSRFDMSKFRVCGNIYENPELID